MTRAAVLVGALAFLVALVSAMVDLPPSPIDLGPALAAHRAASGVEHPVTAVLLNYRGYDTLLEAAVLVVALIGILAVGLEPLRDAPRRPDTVLQTLGRLAAAPMIVVAAYLLWAGATRPGGAFQAAAVLAAAAVLLQLVGVQPAWVSANMRLRLATIAGFGLFLAVATGLLGWGALLQYPPAYAGRLMLAIEFALTVSLGVLLAALFLLLSRDREDPR